jgi:hypothetical protein
VAVALTPPLLNSPPPSLLSLPPSKSWELLRFNLNTQTKRTLLKNDSKPQAADLAQNISMKKQLQSKTNFQRKTPCYNQKRTVDKQLSQHPGIIQLYVIL